MNEQRIDLYAIRQQHGGTVYDCGRRWLGPGPGHSRRDRSLSVAVTDDGRALVNSFASDAFGVCAAYLGIENAKPERLDRDAYDRTKAARQAEARRKENATLAFCERLWAGGIAVEDSPGARYLDARAIAWFPADVLFHPNAPCGYTSDTTAPAMLAVARSVTGAPKAVQATYLTPDCQAKTRRATFGALLGAAVRLSAAGSTLAVAEGLETASSYAKFEGVPTWATLGTANLQAFRPPPCVRRLIIAADGDAAGMKAAHALAQRLRSRCDITIAPAPAGSDWNDVATGRAHV